MRAHIHTRTHTHTFTHAHTLTQTHTHTCESFHKGGAGGYVQEWGAGQQLPR